MAAICWLCTLFPSTVLLVLRIPPGLPIGRDYAIASSTLLSMVRPFDLATSTLLSTARHPLAGDAWLVQEVRAGEAHHRRSQGQAKGKWVRLFRCLSLSDEGSVAVRLLSPLRYELTC